MQWKWSRDSWLSPRKEKNKTIWNVLSLMERSSVASFLSAYRLILRKTQAAGKHMKLWAKQQPNDKHTWHCMCTLIARFLGPPRGPSRADRTQVGPMNFAIWVRLYCLILDRCEADQYMRTNHATLFQRSHIIFANPVAADDLEITKSQDISIHGSQLARTTFRY